MVNIAESANKQQMNKLHLSRAKRLLVNGVFIFGSVGLLLSCTSPRVIEVATFLAHRYEEDQCKLSGLNHNHQCLLCPERHLLFGFADDA
jgi:hypothetical protein